jgi:hypothetical protein
MVDENNTNWGTAYRSGTKYGFEGTSYDADGYTYAPDMNMQEMVYDSDIRLMGNKSYRGRIYGNSADSDYTENHSCGLYISLSEDGISNPENSDWYVRGYFRWHSDGAGSLWPRSHIKMIDIQGSSSGEQWYFQPAPNDSGTSLPTTMWVLPGSSSVSVSNFLQDNRWYCMEGRFKTSSPHEFTVWVDGTQIASYSPSDHDATIWALLFNIINARVFTNLNLSNWTDNLAVSTSRIYPSTMVEISDNATYGAGTVVKQQLYSDGTHAAISDTNIYIKADLTGLGGGPYYLWVTNNKQERSSTYALGDDPPDTTPPSAQGCTMQSASGNKVRTGGGGVQLRLQ